MCAEQNHDDERAAELYGRVWRTDTGFVSAAFGLARVLRRGGRHQQVITALDAVPPDSGEHAMAQVTAIRARLDPDYLEKADLVDASERLKQLRGELIHEAQLSVELLEAKLDWARRHGAEDQDPEFDERRLRLELEQAYRQLARAVPDPDERSDLVDRANSIRPATWF